MKFIILVFFATIVMFFVWNILKRIFFKKFYQQFPFPNQQQSNNANPAKPKPQVNQRVNWDAETVDYEEIREENTNKN